MIQSFKMHFLKRYRNCRNWPALCLAYWLVCFVVCLPIFLFVPSYSMSLFGYFLNIP